MKAVDLIKILNKIIENNPEAEIMFSNDAEGNCIFREAYIQSTELDDNEIVSIFYPDEDSILDNDTDGEFDD